MPPQKPIKQRERKSNTISQVTQSNWIADICWEDLTTDQEQQIWKLQDELQELHNKSEELQLKKIDEAIAFIYSYHGREGQLKVLQWLIFQQSDIMLVVKTSFRKSMIMQVMSYLLCGSVVLIILPLNAIGAEQTARIEDFEDT